MPGFDGTGPRGEGPMTGRGEGYCALPLSRYRPRVAVPGYPRRRFPLFGRGLPGRFWSWLWPARRGRGRGWFRW